MKLQGVRAKNPRPSEPSSPATARLTVEERLLASVAEVCIFLMVKVDLFCFCIRSLLTLCAPCEGDGGVKAQPQDLLWEYSTYIEYREPLAHGEGGLLF